MSKIDYTGKVIEIVNAKMLSDVILKDTSSIALTGAMALAVKNTDRRNDQRRSLKTTIEMFTYNLPANRLPTGDSWDINVTTTQEECRST